MNPDRSAPLYVSPLRRIREAQGMGLRTVAARSGLDAAYISRIERGKSNGSIEALFKIAKVLGMADVVRALAPFVRDDQ